jgi:hypothetical protein
MREMPLIERARPCGVMLMLAAPAVVLPRNAQEPCRPPRSCPPKHLGESVLLVSYLCVEHRRSKPRSVQAPQGAPTRITVPYGRTHGAGKLRPGGLLRAPATAGTSPSRLALSAEVPGDFPQSGMLRGARRARARSPCVCSEACLGGAPPDVLHEPPDSCAWRRARSRGSV